MSVPVTLSKGQNAPLSESSIVVTVDLTTGADLSALLVAADGKVRTDADFIFFNQPDGPGVRCRQPEPGSPWRIEMELAQVPAQIDQVRVVVALEDTSGCFGSFAPPVTKVFDAAGTLLVQYESTGLSSESIVIVLEVYRRGADWKVRAVGQGYAGGLADLIGDHGVSVDADAGPSPAAVPQAPAPVAVPPPAADEPLPPVQVPVLPPAIQEPLPPVLPVPVPVPVPAGGEVSLVKGRSVSLLKGQRVSLRKEDGVVLTVVRMGLGWDAIKKRSMFGSRDVEIDLDASAVMFADQQPLDVIFFNNLSSKDGSVQHLGDNRTGDGDGDDESIMLDLTRVAAQVTAVVFIVTSYEGQTFEQVENAFCRLVDNTTDGEMARYTLGAGGAYTAMVMAKVFRESGTWKLQAIGEGLQARTPIDAVGQLARFVER